MTISFLQIHLLKLSLKIFLCFVCFKVLLFNFFSCTGQPCEKLQENFTSYNEAESKIEKAHFINPNDVLTNWLYSQYYYNLGVDARDAALKIKAPKPEDVKKKADINARAKENFNKAIPYGEKALSTVEGGGFKKSDRSKYKSIVDLMRKIYESLNQNDKAKMYLDKYDAADAKFVN